MTRDEHLAWAKRRALEYLPHNPRNAFTSMISDLRKHPELVDHTAIMMGVGLMMVPGWIDNVGEVRRFVEGFN